MAKKISFALSEESIGKAIRELEVYRNKLPRKMDILCSRLAAMGATYASLGYSRAVYNGNKDIEVSVERSNNGYVIKASGESVLFVEFGAGVTYGYGHPANGEFGFGPGTYPGKGHWDDPKGWWIPVENGGGHTYGNPPSMTMYRTEEELKQAVLAVAQEVFALD